MVKDFKKGNRALKVAGALGAGLLIAGAGMGSGIVIGNMDDAGYQSQITELQKEVKELENQEPVIINNTEVKEVPVNITQIKEVPVDNGKLDLVLSYLQENVDNRDVFDVDDDELDLIVDNVVFELDAKSLAEELVKKEGVEYMDDEEDIFREGDLEEYRDNDVYKFTIEDETSVDDINYEDSEAYIEVVARMKMDNDEDKLARYVKFLVEVEGDSAEIVDAELLE